MAERSFAKEVEKLRLGDGEEFAGEGILAITKALLQSGVGYVGGYQGAPISHLMDVLADAQDILGELGVHFEASASEATATAMLAASVHYPIRGAATFKSTVGTNVASDALANLASGGVTVGDLAVYTVIEQSTLSRTLDTLEAHGLVRRESAETDSRVRKVFLTDEGRAEFNRAWPAMHDAFETMFQDIGDEEYSALVVTLQKMLRNIRKHEI